VSYGKGPSGFTGWGTGEAGPQAPEQIKDGCSWGFGEWGLSPWGCVEPGEDPPIIYDVSPGVLEVEGGTVVTITGANFFPTFIPRVLTGPIGGPYELLKEGFLFDPDFDLTPTVAKPGMPALPTGTYHLQISTPLGLSNVLEDALVYKLHAHPVKAQKGRNFWSPKWAVGKKVGA
jgi:hypothetical protein